MCTCLKRRSLHFHQCFLCGRNIKEVNFQCNQSWNRIGGWTSQKTELSSGGQVPCNTGFPHYVSVPGTHLHSMPAGIVARGCVFASVHLVKNSFNAFAHFMMVTYKLTCPHRAVFSSFWPNTAWPPAPPSLFTCSHPKQLIFCFPLWKKSSKGNILWMWKRWNKKQQKH